MNRSERGSDSTRWVVPLEEIDSGWYTVGGKGANLGELLEAGFDVPNGFCVTTSAYYSLLTDEIRETVRSLDALGPTDPELKQRAQELREFFRTREPPAELHEQVRVAIRSDGRYAVRSSATAEDLPSASFAGQHETYLGVAADDVIDRVLDCMASLFTDRAVVYRSQNGISHADVAIAVVVQEMVDADVAGVLFTADPDSGNRTVASVDAAYGLGETVVAGDVEADNARIEKPTGEVLNYDVGAKQTAVTVERGGTEQHTLPADDRDARVLSDGQLRRLVRLGNRIESCFGSPQDIEWALVDDEFVILQSRPITSLFPLPDPQPTDDRLHVYLSVGHAQAMAESMPPLAVDLWMEVINNVYGELDTTDETSQWAVRAGGRVYEDITPFLRNEWLRQQTVDGLASVNERAAQGLRDLIERDAAFADEASLASVRSILWSVGSVTRKLAPAIPSLLSGFVLSFVRAGDDTAQLRQSYRSWGRRVAAKTRDSDDITERVRSVFDGFPLEAAYTIYARVMPLFAGIAADKALKSIFPEEHDTIDAAGRGASDEVGTRMNLRLSDLEAIAREHPAVEKAIRNCQSLDSIGDVEGGDAFVREFEAFLDVFGHRTTGEIDVSRPRWQNDPAGLLQIVRGNLRTETDETYRDHLRDRQHEAEQAVEYLQNKADHGVLGPLRRRIVRRLLGVYRGYIPLRDEPKHGTAHLFAAWHEELQAAGDHLAANDQLDDPDDVWYLRKNELFELLDAADATGPDIDRRRREHERCTRLDAPPLLTSVGEIPTVTDRDLGDDALAGTGVSSGVIEGTARVISDPSESVLERGEILVAPSCDPGWTPLFRNAAGVVTDVGGRMTHGALVAREYGLPAVMSVPTATTRIETGQRIRVDGSRGVVELIE